MKIRKARTANQTSPKELPRGVGKLEEPIRRTPGRRVQIPESSSSVLGRIVSEAAAAQLLSVRGAARRVGMSPAQMSRVMRGLYGVRSVHLARLIVGLNLSAEQVVAAIYAESHEARNAV